MNMVISVVIPTYKNKERFIDNLRRNLPLLKGNEIIVINDDPARSLKDEFKEFKDVTLIENNINLGFGESANIGIRKAHHKYVMLLNNDVLLRDESYKIALEEFKKSNSPFAIGFAQLEKSGNIVGKNKIYWQRGLFNHQKANDLNSGINAWVEGGSCIIDKEKFIDLGGFDTLYAPFYWEDVDLSYRAWKQGYSILFEPKILVIHDHQSGESSIRKHFSKDFIKTTSFRNQIIFIWKNINDTRMLIEHFIYILPTLFLQSLKGDLSFLRGFIQALAKLPIILESRKTIIALPKTDRDILQKFIA